MMIARAGNSVRDYLISAEIRIGMAYARLVFEKGSVESTHKVPTSHYHAKRRLALRSRRSVD